MTDPGRKDISGILGTLDKYRILWYIVIAALLALGFDFQLPKTKFDALERDIANVRQQMVADKTEVNNALHKDRTAVIEIDRKLDVLIRLACRGQRGDVEFAGGACS